jgi:hypothetical protein
MMLKKKIAKNGGVIGDLNYLPTFVGRNYCHNVGIKKNDNFVHKIGPNIQK